MTTGRLEAFSDGVLAIIITIMVLELKAPEELSLAALVPTLPVFLSYVLSFIYVGIFWNSHHHLFHLTKSVNGKILWANLHLLFWLSLIPFATSWMGEHHLTAMPVFLYGVVLSMSAIAYSILQHVIISSSPDGQILKKALGTRRKEIVSLLIYIAGVVISFRAPLIAVSCYVIVALIWIVPDKRLETMRSVD